MPTKFTRQPSDMLIGSAVPQPLRRRTSRGPSPPAHAKLEGSTMNVLAVQFAHHNHLWDQIPDFEKEYGIKVNIEFAPFDQTREKTLARNEQEDGAL